MPLVAGQRCWIPAKEDVYLPALFREEKGGNAIFKDLEGNVHELPTKDCQALPLVADDQLDGVSNVCDLGDVSQAAVLHTVRTRFSRQVPEVYTRIAQILIAMNPFQQLAIYGNETMKKYISAYNANDLPPHIYTIGNYAVNGLTKADSANQVVLVSGESGAGKTESTKLILSYVAEAMAPANSTESKIQDKIMGTNPILESFGNAMTVRNNNSSRFGKFIDLRVAQGAHGPTIKGCKVDDYLLEVTRVTKQGSGERNYHVFFQVIYAKDKLKDKISPIYDADKYTYIKGAQHKAPGIDDLEFYADQRAAYQSFGMNDDQQIEIFKTVIGILTMGNMTFKAPDDMDNCTIGDEQAVTDTATLLGVSSDTLSKLFVEKQMKVCGEVTIAGRTKSQASMARDTVARQLYGRLFKTIILKLNEQLANGTTDDGQYFGVLDIAGFEKFEFNSLEQLFINLSNEHLQSHFNEQIFQMELDEYKPEGIVIDASLTYQDNSDIIELIDSKGSLLAALDEELSVPKATDITFLNKAQKKFGKHARFVKDKTAKPDEFSIDHFAGLVTYHCEGFLDKNVDNPPPEMTELFAGSSNSMVKGVADLMITEANAGKKAKKTVGSGFRSSLAQLMKKIKKGDSHFIRCIKPNAKKVPGIFEAPMVMNQLNFSGVFEAVRIRQCGYARRVVFADFRRVYKQIMGQQNQRKARSMNDKDYCQTLVDSLPDVLVAVGEYQVGDVLMGKTKVFCRSRASLLMDKALEWSYIGYAVRIQAYYRGYYVRKTLRETKRIHKEIKEWLATHTFKGEGQAASAWHNLKTIEAIEAASKTAQQMLSKHIYIPIADNVVASVDKITKKFAMEVECITGVQSSLQSLDPLQIEQLLTRCKNLHLALPEVSVLEKRLDGLITQLPLVKAMKNVLEAASKPDASNDILLDMQDIWENLGKTGLIQDPSKWIESPGGAELVEKLKAEMETKKASTEVVPEKVEEPEPAQPPDGKRKSMTARSKIDTDFRRRKSTITGLTEEAMTKVVLELAAAMETYDIQKMRDALRECITQGINGENNYMCEAQELFGDLAREEFVHEKLMDHARLVEVGQGDEARNMKAIQNLLAQAKIVGVSESVQQQARAALQDKARVGLRRSVVGGGGLENMDVLNEAFQDLLHFPKLANIRTWKGHKGTWLLAPPEKGPEVMLKHNTHPLLQPLTEMATKSEIQQALQMFENILGWMHDKPRNELQRKNLIQEIVDTAANPDLSDEGYIQVMKQLTYNFNVDERSETAGWQLMLAMLHNVQPTPEIIPYLHAFLIKSKNECSEEDSWRQLKTECAKVIGDLVAKDKSRSTSAGASKFPVQVALVDGSKRKVKILSSTTVGEMIDMLRDVVGVRPCGDWALFQATSNMSSQRLVPTEATVMTTMLKWGQFMEKTGKKSWFVFKRCFLKRGESLDPNFPYDAKLVYIQALEEYKKCPVTKKPEYHVKLASLILCVDQDDYREYIKNVTNGNLTPQGVLEKLVPSRVLKELPRKQLSQAILRDYADHPTEHRATTMARCLKMFQKSELFGCFWWPGKQILGKIAADKNSIPDSTYEDVYKRWKTKGVQDSKNGQDCVINAKSKRMEYILAINEEGIRFVQLAKAGISFSRTFCFASDKFERVILWSAKSNMLQILVTTVGEGGGGGKALLRINYQTAAAMDITFTLKGMNRMKRRLPNEGMDGVEEIGDYNDGNPVPQENNDAEMMYGRHSD